MKRSTKPGYVYSPGPSYRSGKKYPFELIKEGESLQPPYPLADLETLRCSVNRWRRLHQTPLTITRVGDGLVVGWDKNSPPVQKRPRKKS